MVIAYVMSAIARSDFYHHRELAANLAKWDRGGKEKRVPTGVLHRDAGSRLERIIIERLTVIVGQRIEFDCAGLWEKNTQCLQGLSFLLNGEDTCKGERSG